MSKLKPGKQVQARTAIEIAEDLEAQAKRMQEAAKILRGKRTLETTTKIKR